MQAIYNFHQKEEANFNLQLDFLDEHFSPDLNSMEVQDREQLKKDRQYSKNLFEKWFTTKEVVTGGREEINDALEMAIRQFEQNHKKDIKATMDFMLKDVEDISYEYLVLLFLIKELGDYTKVYLENQDKKKIGKLEFARKNIRLHDNKIMKSIRESVELEDALIRKNVKVTDKDELIKHIFLKTLQENKDYKAYLELEETTFEDDLNIIRKIISEVVLQDVKVQTFFEEMDLQWIENRAIVKGMCQKSVKDLVDDPVFKLVSISPNWEEDKEFFEKLFEEAVKADEELDELIEKKLKNWDKERVALTDKIILKMAVVELLSFPYIPVKVSINEYIELSKNYSTPKSKQFVNGVLDSVSKELHDQGRIKKSGRGLIDNK